jgi:hypothetical protein
MSVPTHPASSLFRFTFLFFPRGSSFPFHAPLEVAPLGICNGRFVIQVHIVENRRVTVPQARTFVVLALILNFPTLWAVEDNFESE